MIKSNPITKSLLTSSSSLLEEDEQEEEEEEEEEDFFWNLTQNDPSTKSGNDQTKRTIRRHNNDTHTRIQVFRDLDDSINKPTIHQKRPRSHHYQTLPSSFQFDLTPTKPKTAQPPHSSSCKRPKTLVLDELLIDNEGLSLDPDYLDNSRSAIKQPVSEKKLQKIQLCFSKGKENKADDSSKTCQKAKNSNSLTGVPIFSLAQCHRVDSPSKSNGKPLSSLQGVINVQTNHQSFEPNSDSSTTNNNDLIKLAKRIDPSITRPSILNKFNQFNPSNGGFKPSALSNQIPPIRSSTSSNKLNPATNASGSLFIPPESISRTENLSTRSRLVQVSPTSSSRDRSKRSSVGPLVSRLKMISELDDTRLRMWRSDFEAGTLSKGRNINQQQQQQRGSTKKFKVLKVVDEYGIRMIEGVEEIEASEAPQARDGGDEIDDGDKVWKIVLSNNSLDQFRISVNPDEEEDEEEGSKSRRRYLKIFWPWNQVNRFTLISDRFIIEKATS